MGLGLKVFGILGGRVRVLEFGFDLLAAGKVSSTSSLHWFQYLSLLTAKHWKWLALRSLLVFAPQSSRFPPFVLETMPGRKAQGCKDPIIWCLGLHVCLFVLVREG